MAQPSRDRILVGAAALAAVVGAAAVLTRPPADTPAPIEVEDLEPAAPEAPGPDDAAPTRTEGAPEAPWSVPDDAFTVLDGGLAVADLDEGTGPRPEDDQVVVHDYSLWLADGTLVDSSRSRGEPMRVQLGRLQVVQGWERALRGMAVGGRRQARIPAALGFGAKPPASVPADADLVLDLHLLAVEPPRTPPEAPPAPTTWEPLGDGGLEIADLTVGTGTPATDGAGIALEISTFDAEGTLIDSTLSRSTPFRFVLGEGRALPALAQGVVGMREGGVRALKVPAALSPGGGSAPADAPPRILQIELVDVDEDP